MDDYLEAIKRAIKYITSIRDENFIILHEFKKEIEENKDSKTSYSTSIYDNRIENCNTILKVLKRQVPRAIQFDTNDLNFCPVCREAVKTDDKYCCNCGQRIFLD